MRCGQKIKKRQQKNIPKHPRISKNPLQSQLLLTYPIPPPNNLRTMSRSQNVLKASSLLTQFLVNWRLPRNLRFIMSCCTSVELCCIFHTVRVGPISIVLTANRLSRWWCHVLPDALLGWLNTVGDCGSQTHRHLHVTEGLHFQTLLRIRCYHWDHRKGAAAESAAGFGETPTKGKPKETELSLEGSITKIHLFWNIIWYFVFTDS